MPATVIVAEKGVMFEQLWLNPIETFRVAEACLV
jgi:hypothetical protein